MQTTTSHIKQGGMVLVICLIMLLLLTLTGLAAIQGSALQEKMAGNSRDSEHAFLAAEATLRDGEDLLAASGASLTFATDGSNGLYDKMASGATATDWRASGTVWRTASTISGIAETPRFYIERWPEIINKGKSLEADTPLETTIIYRVTASSVGQTGTSRAVLQSTFRR
ncbi:MAG: pilus assembly PilX family protein [Aeromonadaceae bacterium]